MPAKNTLKLYANDSYYHLYNRGVNKVVIYNDDQDYRVFLHYLKTYLTPKDYDALNLILANPTSPPHIKSEALKELNLKNFYGKIILIAYCLMPNHFHLLVHTKEGHDIEYFMRSLMTRYTKYLNQRNKRIGPLFQGRYKAVLVESDEQLLYLTRYIHRNPLEAYLNKIALQEKQPVADTYTILTKQPSSYPVYLDKIQQPWVQPNNIIAHFSKNPATSYKNFIEETNETLERESFSKTHIIAIDLEE